jgi:hypothetical protein
MITALEANALAGLSAVRHGFFTRRGGASTGIYAGLNCGLGSGDDSALVIENRARAARHLGASDDRVLTVHQVHSPLAVVVDRHLPRADLPKADAAVTATRGFVIGVLAADCGPVLFADADAGVVAAAHAGWRGAAGGVLEQTVAAMEGLGARRERIRAALGPCINQQSYEVGPEFEADLLARDPANAAFFAPLGHGGRSHFDLPGYVMGRLSRLGLAATERQATCTYENESEFFSFRRTTHRKEPDYGRQLSAIMLI